MYAKDVPPGQIFYHGTKADLAPGDLIGPGFTSNFAERELSHIYFSASLEAATWGAELAQGDRTRADLHRRADRRVEDDPNLTDRKFPGNRTASYRSRDPLRSSARSRIGRPFARAAPGHEGRLARMEAEGTGHIID